MAESDFNYLMRLGSQLVIAAGNLSGEPNVSPLLITRYKDMDKQLKLTHRVVDIVHRLNGNI